MTITFRHPDAHHHPWQWLAAGAAAVALTAGAYTGFRALTDSDTSDRVPAATTYVDASGLDAIFGVRFPATYVDASGLDAIFGVRFPDSRTYVDPTGLGQVLSTEVPTG